MTPARVWYVRPWGAEPAPDRWCPGCCLPSVLRLTFDLTTDPDAGPEVLQVVEVCEECAEVRQGERRRSWEDPS